ncbi:MAG: AAA family ATPase [Alphaproteobacteria bacterium]|nr:AAA family ATPase [Alphaproteobacteria bacterium]
MKFTVVPNKIRVPAEGRNCAYLWTDNWNDWFEFNTLYVLTYFDNTGTRYQFGGVKIGQFNWQKDQARPAIPEEFEELGEEFFSLGQDVSYYAAISKLEANQAAELLRALRDLVADPPLFERAARERVTGTSLLRSVSPKSITGQFRRLLIGGVALTEFSFEYEGPNPPDNQTPRLKLAFNVVPDSSPPTNIHVLIGRNGVGKSFLLNGMTRALVSTKKNEDREGVFKSTDQFATGTEMPFANVVSVTFSAFDDFALLPEPRNTLKGVRYSNIGLRHQAKTPDGEPAIITRDPADLAKDFSGSAKICLIGERSRRWKHALSILETDPIFQEAQVAKLGEVDVQQVGRPAAQLFRRLSSGHKIVLLTITKLVEKVEERTLVLMDEPEAHLHPPLLSAFVRAISDLLINRNGVAVIATHSPVILQEVPASCVWKIVRHGAVARADRPEIETFGENVGILTQEVFGLEVVRSGFHRMLADAIGDARTIDQVLAKFDNEVGSEGRALISSLIANRDVERGQ